MAEPITLMTIASVTSAISGVVGAIGAIQEGNAAEAAANYNATIARQDAEVSRQQTAADVERQRRENYLRAGATRAASGVSGGLTGSALDIGLSNAAQGELDILNIQQTGALQQRSLLNTASLDEMQGKAASRSSKLKAAGSLLGGASQAASYGSRI